MPGNYNQPFPKPLLEFFDDYKLQRCNLSPEFQRDEVWNNDEKSYLIDTIMKGLPIPTIYIATMREKYGEKYIVVDGKQRLLSIIAFLENRIRLPADFDKDDLGYSRMNSRTYSELMELMQNDARVKDYINRFREYVIPFIRINEPSEERITDIFDRLNRGRVLNTAERIHGMYVHTLIYQAVKEVANHPVLRRNMKACREINSNRMLDVFFAANLFFSLLEGGVIEGSDKSIIQRYKKHQNIEAEEIRKVKTEFDKCMVFLEKIKIDLALAKINRPSHLYSLFTLAAYCVTHKISYSEGINAKVIEFYRKYNNKEFTVSPVWDYSNAIMNSANSKRSRKVRGISLLEYCGLYAQAPAFCFKFEG